MEEINDETLYSKFIDDLKLQGKTPKTIENYGSCLKDFKNWLHDRGKKFIDVQKKEGLEILREYLKRLKQKNGISPGKQLSYARLKIYFSTLNSFFDFLLIEGIIEANIVLAFRKHYLRTYKNSYVPASRQYITAEEMSRFLKGIYNLQDKTIALLLVKTGIRKGELLTIDVDDVDFERRIITLKERKKRSNCKVVFDEECSRVLKQWLVRREQMAKEGEKSLFLNEYGNRIHHNKPYLAITYWAKRAGLHDPFSHDISKKFGCHCLRHCFSNYLVEGKMYEPFIEWLRGDSPGKAIDVYKHISIEKVREAYDKAMPVFGI